MDQLTQNLKDGFMQVMEVPFPALYKGCVLVRNHFSVISAGTEGKTVTDARKGYIAKAKSRKKEVSQVIDMVRTNGPLATYKLVMNKLEAPAALGYSTAGEVIAVGEGVTEFKVGDRVACGGLGASHADVVAVPVKLCVKVPDKVSLRHAAFSTLAAISIQGIRQGDLKVGENCLIIGMGLIGQLTAKILRASGIRSIGVDISDEQVNLAKASGIERVYNRGTAGIEELVLAFSKGHGVDAVIITAGTSSLDPIELAGRMARKKGKVIIVGAVPTGFDRVNYYKKELDLRMSMSYGPGRGDIAYEQKGIDYPIGYVRWTENRNMQSYLDLLEDKSLNIEPLISHSYTLEEAPMAYEMILSKKEVYSGLLIQYDIEKELTSDIELSTTTVPDTEANIGVLGAGNFAQSTLLPKMKGNCNFVALTSGQGNTAKYVAEKYGFHYLTDDTGKILNDDKVNTLFIITRHDSHARLVMEGIRHNKHVFVEKPLALTENELEEVKNTYDKALTVGKQKSLMVGFNRRFAPATQKIKSLTEESQPKSISIRVNAGVIDAQHWTNDMDIGGGRIIGEACHFIDLAMYLAGAKIISVQADAMKNAHELNDTVTINLTFANGSIATINYFANGSKKLPKEQIDVFSAGVVFSIDDFRKLRIAGDTLKTVKYKDQDKGHAREIKLYLDGITNGNAQLIPFEECYLSSLTSFKVLQSISENRKINISL